MKLKLHYFGHLMKRTDSLKNTLMLGKIEGGRRREGNDRGWDGWMASPTQWTWVWVSSGSWWWTGRPVCCSPWGHKESDTTEGLNWTELNWCWTWSFNTLATWCKELTHWKKKPWCWEKLRERGQRDNGGWNGWMASLTQWTWVWASSGRWWRTGKLGVLHSMGSQRVRHDWATELNWTDTIHQ